jgi:homoserine trans-succinylase
VTTEEINSPLKSQRQEKLEGKSKNKREEKEDENLDDLDQDFVEPHAKYADTFATNARESHHVQVASQKRLIAAENA